MPLKDQKMTDHGDIYDTVEKLEVPEDLKNELSNNETAQKNFEHFSNSNKKQILWYITSAKKIGN
jgi:uncharacterized protein YdeI (YjbR/CyaY-like superfamily)